MEVADQGATTSKYGLIPLMVKSSKFEIGCLNAESHNERMISVANDVVTKVNTLLSDDKIEMLVVLQINVGFMEYMRIKYGQFSRQQFNKTIVQAHDEENDEGTGGLEGV